MKIDFDRLTMVICFGNCIMTAVNHDWHGLVGWIVAFIAYARISSQ